jgi:hypothetical protein
MRGGQSQHTRPASLSRVGGGEGASTHLWPTYNQTHAGFSFSYSPISVLLRQPLSIKKSYAGAVQSWYLIYNQVIFLSKEKFILTNLMQTEDSSCIESFSRMHNSRPVRINFGSFRQTDSGSWFLTRNTILFNISCWACFVSACRYRSIYF